MRTGHPSPVAHRQSVAPGAAGSEGQALRLAGHQTRATTTGRNPSMTHDTDTGTTTTDGPWHDVTISTETAWNGAAVHTGPVYSIGHPANCGWTPNGGDCPFEDEFDDADDDGWPTDGEFMARAWTEWVSFDDGNKDVWEQGIAWVPATQTVGA